MKKILTIFGVALFLTSTCIYLPLSGKVIDSETGRPIEGAVVLAEWTITHGFGLTYHTLHKIVETKTDNNGKFSLPGVYNPFVDKPNLLIYKRGYIAWNKYQVLEFSKASDGTIEANFTKRNNYSNWEHGYVYKLAQFKEGYSHNKNLSLLCCFMGASMNATPLFEEAETYELKMSQAELDRERVSRK